MQNGDYIKMNCILSSTALTPVEIHDGLYLKRDDLYRPFGENSVNGGKLRQCFELIKAVEKDYDGVISCCSIYSPQAPITSAVANFFNKKAVICYGATTLNRLETLDMPLISKEYGADIRIISKSGIHKILYNKAKQIAQKENLFVVDYGFNITKYPDIMYSAVSMQVENIPDYLDNLVVTCGSGISTIGILLGLQKFNKKVKNIYLVATAPNRDKLIKNTLFLYGIFPEYTIIDLFHTPRFHYEDELIEHIDGIQLHPNYEAKAYNWLKNNIDYKREKTLLWIVGAKPKLREEQINGE